MAESFRVICAHCQRSYPWKQEQAGKRGRCKCGQVLTIPLESPGQEPQDDLFELAELAGDAKLAKVDPPIAAPVAAVPVAAVAAQALSYARAPVARNSDSAGSRRSRHETADGLTDLVRDIYVPTGIFAAGFLAALIWVVTQTPLGSTGLVIMSVVVSVLTAIKVAIVIGVALFVAQWIGVSFGLFRHAILKFAAIVVFIDSMGLWLRVIMRAAGAISAHGKAPVGYIWLEDFCLGILVFAACCMYLFRMDSSEAATFSIAMAVVSWLIGIFVAILTVIIIGIFVAPRTSLMGSSMPTVPTLPTGRSAAFANAPLIAAPGSGSNSATFFDVAITQRIQHPAAGLLIVEGNQWKQSNRYSQEDKAIDGLIDQMYAAGATKVYIDTSEYSHPLAYVELPSAQSMRDACSVVADAYRKSNSLPQPSPTARLLNHQYLVVLLKK